MDSPSKYLDFSDITFPCLIHGLQGSGASQFTISLAAYLANQNKRILYFCAFPPGKEKLLQEVKSDKLQNVTIVNPGDEKDFTNKLSEHGGAVDYVIIKNFESYSKTTQQHAYKYTNVILSGGLDSVAEFGITPATTILFSPTKMMSISMPIPSLEKYTGILIREDLSGKIKLQT